MWTDVVDFACLWVYKPGEARFLGTSFNDLPGAMTVNTKDKPFPILKNGTAFLNKFFEHHKCPGVDGERPHPAVLLFLSQCLRYFQTTAGAIGAVLA
jgi:hypothetical protein